MIETPVVLFVFNRPDLTEIVFNAIARVKPKTLFVIADGPRFPEEVELCKKTREIINKVDWKCELFTDFSEVNLYATPRIHSGLNWVFSQVEEAIIFEDDCLPSDSFFTFCEELLSRYRNDDRIMHISGNNFQGSHPRTSYSYYFSKYLHGWGWASWRRAWKHLDLSMKTWSEFKQEGLLDLVCEDRWEKLYWIQVFDRCFTDGHFEWDYSWLYTGWSQNRLSIIPNVNLVSNIGFRADATHLKNGNSPLANIPAVELENIKHPPCVVRHKEADNYTFDYVFGGKKLKELHTIRGKIAWRIERLYEKMKGKI
ncbi:glycosyltransferase family 2 protein [Oscillatoria sp. FACHB-1406]|uniref:glycosyltransferase family 2 protein n=1 Tax=Oscillatoria sp. FACHB-1406 TaxID=2692846 RepID=UPI001682D321|nr:glycosyltransferase family 2 protein [Oscillatoria sp. FACHB-1406]MBD2579002.1 glycosyltransferase family 2 protein [Oscillatoria sp. FACHB-1406]